MPPRDLAKAFVQVPAGCGVGRATPRLRATVAEPSRADPRPMEVVGLGEWLSYVELVMANDEESIVAMPSLVMTMRDH